MRCEPLLADLFELQMQWPFCSTWTEGQPSHSGTLDCVWLLMSCDSDGTRSWSSTGEHTSLLSEFLLVCLWRLPLLSCTLQLALFGSGTGPWSFEGPGRPPSILWTFMCSLFSRSDHRLFVELWSKWAPQPLFEASVKSWDTMVFGVRVCTCHHVWGILPPT